MRDSLLSFFLLVALAGFSRPVASQNKTSLVMQVRSQVDSLQMPAIANSVLGTNESFMRYLKQSNYQVKTAVSKIQKTATWRSANNVENLAKDDISLLKDILPYEQSGTTKDGNPVFYLPVGKWNLRKVQRSGQNSRLQSYIIQIFEKSLRTVGNEVNKRTQEPISESIFIIDLQGLTLRQALSGYGRTISTFVRSAQIYEHHYPNTIKKWYIIRAPRNFRVVWSLARRFVPRDVAKNVEVYSRYSTRWRNALKNNIPNDALPKTLRL